MEAVATVVLDLPAFDTNSYSDAYGTISYNVDEREYQTPIATVRLLVGETIDNSCGLKFSTDVEQSISGIEEHVDGEDGRHTNRGKPWERGVPHALTWETHLSRKFALDVYALKATWIAHVLFGRDNAYNRGGG